MKKTLALILSLLAASQIISAQVSFSVKKWIVSMEHDLVLLVVVLGKF